MTCVSEHIRQTRIIEEGDLRRKFISAMMATGKSEEEAKRLWEQSPTPKTE